MACLSLASCNATDTPIRYHMIAAEIHTHLQSVEALHCEVDLGIRLDCPVCQSGSDTDDSQGCGSNGEERVDSIQVRMHDGLPWALLHKHVVVMGIEEISKTSSDVHPPFQSW